MDDTARLYELQKVDLTWDKVRRRLLHIQKLLGESDKVQKARDQVTAVETELQEWRNRQKNAELESRSLAGRIQETEEKLMSGTVHNTKELTALQASLEALRRHRAAVDDSAMEALMKADELDQKLAEERATLTQLEAEWQEQQVALKREGLKLKQHYVLLKQKRSQLSAALDQELLERYEHLRKRKGGIAIAALENDICGACHVQVPTGVISAIHAANHGLVYCPSCGRMLFAG
ncbi:C4-type zinc ribbon domain-containing protein [Litorilinea aerophila]|uniref:Uncharacterized protein n=1 Tax=Litorilinea aerophila TaxID=1204385 RepID=A0A540VBG9_9CHLR|nr:C4-type zinc ribbon domain-containing protein [Litorilinea aerophila]MCC9078006.1 C4-type zinc ribbon domain-containing protein [Litorilinea aerophila]GIV75953.1 MAG: hypothetical protein KatS3mg050_0347 [Litorilinea sp.]